MLENASKRPVLSQLMLTTLLSTIVVAVATWHLAVAYWRPTWAEPGEPVRFAFGVLAGLLALLPLAYFLAKRSALSNTPNPWLIAHIVAGILGLAFAYFHAGFRFTQAPGLLLLAYTALVIQGAWARTEGGFAFSHLFAAQSQSILSSQPPSREQFHRVIQAKTKLLKELDAQAIEATFSPQLKHWFNQPGLAWRYWRLSENERQLMDQYRSLPSYLRWWRRLHMLIALALIIGLIVHVITVLFFAGYVADGRPINWWHIQAWGAGTKL